MKIYTKGGDQGSTSLIGGERVPKYDVRVEAYGSIDELSAQTAMLRDMLNVVSQAHICRTVCRRAERQACRAAAQYPVSSNALMFLNRLSDYFYVLGRRLAMLLGAEEILWEP